jgi:murein DD-endopeptidase MepM/ murein hydrolase activator NlpD
LSRIRKMEAIAALAAAAAIMLVASAPTGASSSCRGGSHSGGTGMSAQDCRGKGYVNPFKHRRWISGRIDMGVDYVPYHPTAVVAIGDAKILGSDSHSGWPGGHFIWYKLTDGDHAGDIIYVAEELKKMVPAKTRVAAGQRIATARPGGSGLEIGWANRLGETRAARCYSEGMRTNSGKEMARFLRSLGAKVVDHPGRGANEPRGKRC